MYGSGIIRKVCVCQKMVQRVQVFKLVPRWDRCISVLGMENNKIEVESVSCI